MQHSQSGVCVLCGVYGEEKIGESASLNSF